MGYFTGMKSWQNIMIIRKIKMPCKSKFTMMIDAYVIEQN